MTAADYRRAYSGPDWQARELLPPIRTVTSAPVLVPNGERVRVLGPGYHADNGGTLVSGGEMPPDFPPADAAALLLGLLDEFSFQSNGDRARAFANMLCPALKLGGFVRGNTPVDVREADEPQTAKPAPALCFATLPPERFN